MIKTQTIIRINLNEGLAGEMKNGIDCKAVEVSSLSLEQKPYLVTICHEFKT
ncbi:MAG TPA: hypothetical protein VJ729_14400 [Nitrososphaeraceae archaeon]|jgi:hypothetical protein|nr:hypothetical protein [Nitrososphaeraceae archaeon]